MASHAAVGCSTKYEKSLVGWSRENAGGFNLLMHAAVQLSHVADVYSLSEWCWLALSIGREPDALQLQACMLLQLGLDTQTAQISKLEHWSMACLKGNLE